jgi:hypothetical protein
MTTTTADLYDDKPPNWVGRQIDPTASDQVMRALGNRGPTTAAERLACAAVLYRHGCRDLLPMLGLTDD